MTLNVAELLQRSANDRPHEIAIACAVAGKSGREDGYRTTTFEQLAAEVDQLSRGMMAMGIGPGVRIVLLVPCGIEFVMLVFALLKSGATLVLIDPGMGRKHLLDCLAAVEPDGFIGVPRAQAVRAVLRRRFPQARLNVTVGRRWFWRGETLASLRRLGGRTSASLPTTQDDDPAAIVFTSGSTGPPKGVLYRHETFTTQASEIRDFYCIDPGGFDLACFPLFGLFNAVMGVTTVFPEMDFSRPASCDPSKVLAAANDWQVTQAFASPAVWDKLSCHCQQHGTSIPSLRRVFSCGAPVPADVLRRTLACVHPDAQMHTPYGATEALPVSSIEASEVLGETADKTDSGAGVCVGRKFNSADWKIIRITDEPIATLSDAQEMPIGEIGELIVRGPQVSRQYVTQIEANASSKIIDGEDVWHRMGDIGYFDDNGRFWYCGRKVHRVTTAERTYYSACAEGVFNTHPAVERSALVETSCDSMAKSPRICFTTTSSGNGDTNDVCQDLAQLANNHQATRGITAFERIPKMPVDVRHNAKIDREALSR